MGQAIPTYPAAERSEQRDNQLMPKIVSSWFIPDQALSPVV